MQQAIESSPAPVRPLADVERELIITAIEQCGGMQRAAEQLRISVRTLQRKAKAYRLQGFAVPLYDSRNKPKVKHDRRANGA